MECGEGETTTKQREEETRGETFVARQTTKSPLSRLRVLVVVVIYYQYEEYCTTAGVL